MPEINQLLEEMTLKICKCKNVKTPSKSWAAAGWDFFIPEDLTIFDFAKSYKSYLDDSIEYDKDEVFVIPIVFYIKAAGEKTEKQFQLILSWNKKTSEWEFSIIDYVNLNNLSYYDKVDLTPVKLTSSNARLIKWLKKDGTYVTKMVLNNFARILIPSGIHVNLPENVLLKADNKSGIASKRGLIVGADIIDVDYEGEVHINLINTSGLPVMIQAGEKIVQFIPMFQPIMRNVEEFDSIEKLYEGKNSQRGAGGFGSSGEK